MFTFAGKGKYILTRGLNTALFLALLLAFWAGCRPKYAPTPVAVTFNDFENMTGWVNTPTNNSQTIIPCKAHSGKHASLVDHQHNFSYTYKSKFSDIVDRKISWVKISGYCKTKSGSFGKASVVCNITDNTNTCQSWNLCSLHDIAEEKKDKWVHFEKAFDLHAVSKPDYYMEAYVWSTDPADRVLVDDLKIEFFD